jgi:putative alpha-1,2-mannosidase
MIPSIAMLVAFGRYRRTILIARAQWDTYRTLYPLMSLHDPEVFARIVRGMINIQQHEGDKLLDI